MLKFFFLVFSFAIIFSNWNLNQAYADKIDTIPSQDAKSLSWIKNQENVKILEYFGNWYCGIGENNRFACASFEKNPGLSLDIINSKVSLGILFPYEGGPTGAGGTMDGVTIIGLKFSDGYDFQFHQKAILPIEQQDIVPLLKHMIESKTASVFTKEYHQPFIISLNGSERSVKIFLKYAQKYHLSVPSSIEKMRRYH